MLDTGRLVFLVLLGTCMVCIFLYCMLFTYFPREGASETPSTQTTQIRALPLTMPQSPPSCVCPGGYFFLNSHIPRESFNATVQRRAEEFRQYKTRTRSTSDTLLFSLANSPLQYPIQGVIVRPLTNATIPGLALYAGQRDFYKVTLSVSKGLLDVQDPSNAVEVTGKGGKKLTMVSRSLEEMNELLATVSYTSTIYRIQTADQAHFLFENHEAVFSIVIKVPKVPVLYDIGTDISSQVTITTKTFLRYRELHRLLASIRLYYPDVKVIIADDSFQPENITGDNIEQYKMPPAKGWFAGRNLAVSQVTTKYFLWVDDDFLFTADTKIEKLVEVMEANPELDMVGASVGGNRFYFSLYYEEGQGEDGGCLKRKSGGRFHSLPGFPQCFLTSGVVNFFLARTDSVRKVGFDPLLSRVAHSEFFMDGLGTFLVASCAGVSIGHQKKGKADSDHVRYSSFRRPKTNDQELKLRLHFYKNHLKCLRYG